MAFFSMGKRVKNQKFNYIPRHYDATKEALEERRRMASGEQDPELSKMRIKDGFRRKARGNKELESKLRRQSNIRLVVIVAVVLVGTYYFMMSDGLQNFIREMSGDTK